MADLLVKDTSLTAVANAIRAKTGGSSPITFPNGFESAIGDMIIPSGNQDIDTLYEYDVAAKATARISATERAKIIPENIAKDITILGVTGTHEGSIKPSYCFNDGDEITDMYFNTASDLSDFLSGLEYTETDPYFGYDACPLGLGFYGVDYGGYYGLVWEDEIDGIELYTTDDGWIESEFSPTEPFEVDLSELNEGFAEIIDYVVATEYIAFGDHGIFPTGNQDIENLNLYGVYDKSTAQISATERAKIIPENIADGVTILGVQGTHQGGAQPQLNAPTISVSSSGNQSVISISNPATNGNFVEKYGVYLDGTWSFDTTSTSNIPITTLGNHSVTVKACGTDFEDSPASNTVTVNNYTITVTCVDCTPDVGNPTYISNNGATATLVFTPDTDLEIRAESVVINGASVVSVDKTTGTVVIGTATANVVMTVTALEPLTMAILTVLGLGNQDPTTVVFTEEGAAFDWNFQEVTIDGNIFIKIPTMYRKVNTVVDNQITSFSLSNQKVDNDYKPYPCFLDSDGTTVLDYVLIGKYCSSSTSVMNSVNATLVAQTLAAGRTNARALGAGYQLYDWQIQKLFVDLAMMKAKTVNFQDGSATISEYLGIAHIDQSIWIDGIYHNDTVWYVALNPNNYVSNPSGVPTGYSALSYSDPTETGTNYEVKALGYDSNNPFVNYPSAVASNSSCNTYYCDRYNYTSGSQPVYTRVGFAGAAYGLWRHYGEYGWLFTAGVRLCYRPISS